jgi:tetratricopeptide (TPR) repeat protein
LVLAVSAWSQAQPGSIVFLTSTPLAAEVILDGRILDGRTPLLLRDLSPGQHDLALKKQGFLSSTLKLRVVSAVPQALSVDLVEQGISTIFPSEKEVLVSGKKEAAGERMLYFQQGGLSIAREQGVLYVDPLFPQQRLIDALNITIPIMLVFASLLTVDAVLNPPQTDWPLPPSVLAAHGITLSLVGLDIGLNLHKRRQMRAYSLSTRVTEANQRSVRSLYAEAERLLQDGSLDEALEVFSRLVRSYPESPLLPEALYRLGSIHYLKGENDEAVSSFESLARDYPVAELYDRCQKNLADLMLGLGQFESSLRHLDQMVFLDPLYSREEIAFYRCSILEEWSQADPVVRERLRLCREELIERYPDSADIEAVRRQLRE